MTQNTNDNLVLISGATGTGKSASLRNINNPEGVFYANCESNKKLPFPSKFKQFTITDPYQIFEMFDVAETKPEIHTIIIDSITFLMEMYEAVYVKDAKDGRVAWGNFAHFFKTLMQQYVARSTKNVLMTAHTLATLSEEGDSIGVIETKVPIKGSLKNQGIESWFSTVVSTKTVKLKALEPYSSDLLNISEEDGILGYKHCFQTKKTASTTTERMRAPMGMFSVKESFIDNDAQLLLNQLNKYYN